MLKMWIRTFGMILIGTLIGGAVLYGIGLFAGVPLTYRMATGLSFVGSYFSAINQKNTDDASLSAEGALTFIMTCGIVSIAVGLMHFGFRLFGA